MEQDKPIIKYPRVHMGEAIHKVLKQKGISQKRFAKGIGLSPTNINRIFQRREISMRRLRLISDFLGYDFLALLPSAPVRELIRKGQEMEELTANLASKEKSAQEKEMVLMLKIQDLEKEIEELNTSKEQEIAALKKVLHEEIERRREAEVQIRVLEGKLEILLR